MDMAYAQLTKATLKPFLMRIWGPGAGADNDEGRRPSPLSDKREESVTDRVKDWLESLDAASQLTSSNASTLEERRAKRHSFHGCRSEQLFSDGSHRDRSTSPASSFSSLRETSEVSSVSSATQGTSSRIEAILRRREAQKEFEKGRKSKKEAHADGSKRRWTLASVFNAKKPGQTTKRDTFAAAGSSAEKSSSQTTLTSDTTQLDSSSSGATVSMETLASIEATGAKPKTFLGRFSSFKNESRKKESKATEAIGSDSADGFPKTFPTGDVPRAETQNLQFKRETSKDDPNSNCATKAETNQAHVEASSSHDASERVDAAMGNVPFSANRNAIENIKQSIHAAKLSFMASAPGAIVHNTSADASGLSTNFRNSQNSDLAEGEATALAAKAVEKSTESREERPDNKVKSELKERGPPAPQVKEKSNDTNAASSSSSHVSSSLIGNQPNESTNISEVGKSTNAASKLLTSSTTQAAIDASGSNEQPAQKETMSEGGELSTASAVAPKVVVHSADTSENHSDAAAPGPSADSSSKSGSYPQTPTKGGKQTAAVGDPKTANAYSTESQERNDNKEETRAGGNESEGAALGAATTRKLGNRLPEAATPRRRERVLTNGTAEGVEQETLKPSAAGKGGPNRRPSLRRTSRENSDDCVVRDRDGNALIVKPQKPIERRGSVNARPGLQISKAVAANIAKLRSVPPPKKRKQVVQPRPAGKLPTEKQKQYKVLLLRLVRMPVGAFA
ncbi:hypothetical protein V5799_027166 [Amblyomma americanum]|uniref:Uncharacterized protein n=1 Tax=Amblyomma americanum TaxID=6943 RepID=A0AAQ4DGH7_AMBAM